MKKKYRIRSHTRFTVFLVLIMISTVYFTGLAFGNSQAVSLTEPSYIEVVVQSGDTLWDLAAIYGPDDQDIRNTVHTISRINGITPEDIQPGDILLIPQQ